jgi:uncharacterized protein YjbI with pentapeptide repeats
MLYEIKSRVDGHVLFSLQCDSIKACLEAGVRADAQLDYAQLNYAQLYHASFDCASLVGAQLSWQSHDLIAELLHRAAGDDIEKRSLAGLVLVSRDWCWDKFLRFELSAELRGWATATLAAYVQDGDDAPPELRRAATKLKQGATEGKP